MTTTSSLVNLSDLSVEKIKRTVEHHIGFDVITEEDIQVNGESAGSYVKLKIYYTDIKNTLCWSGIRPDSEGIVALDSVTKFLKTVREQFDSNYGVRTEEWDEFFAVVGHYHSQREAVIRARTDIGMCAFDDLETVFAQGTKLTYCMDPLTAGEIESCVIYSGFMGETLRVVVRVIKNIKGKPVLSSETVTVPGFSGVVKISSLPIHVTTKDEMETLTIRGMLFRDMAAKGAAYMSYNGAILRKGYWSNAEYKANGRCVIDPVTMRKVDPDYFNNIDGGDVIDVEVEGLAVPDDKLWMCEPRVYGFSFTAKVWGEFRVDLLSDINFQDKAFDKLVLDETRKKTIRALVENNGGSFSDIIDGKGGGCIFLLHGPPGTGKTLTAEAVAEVLRRPLYSVSVGELGTDPEKLEKSLRTILEVSTAWNAVVLLDEADIFLEARNEENILRNAMVGVFLRLLEYHQGVLFLTTNRVKNFDKAFHSRISIAINYPEMDNATRYKIWTNLLDSAKICASNISVGALSEADINGRQIKNVIRLAQTLARSEKREVAQSDLEGMIKVVMDFNHQVG